MSLKSYVNDKFYRIYSSEKTNRVLALFQLLAIVSGFLYPTYKDSRPDIAWWFFYSFFFFQLIVFLFFIMLLIPGEYRAIKLRLNRYTGVLYDSTTNFRNVSLRADTLNLILDYMGDGGSFAHGGKTYNIGKIVGENFYNSFETELLRQGQENYSIDDKLKKWLEYDSSSGMGKFELFQHSDRFLKLKIISPFVGSCPNQKPNPGCYFLLGYIDGFCSMLFGQNLNSKCTHTPDPSYCLLTIPLNPSDS